MEVLDLAVIAAVLSIGAFIKGATGMGLPLISIPILTSTLGLTHAIGVLLLPIIVTNAWQAIRFRKELQDAKMRFLWPMVAASVAGMAIGTAGLATLNERLLVLVLAGVIFLYVGLRLTRPDIVLGQSMAMKLSLFVGVLAGALQGATGISSPIAATYVHAMRLSYGAHVFALSVVFLVATVAQLPALAVAGILQWRWIGEGVFALLPVVCFLPLGQKLGAYIDQALFDRVILIFLAIIGTTLVFRGLTAA
jgi:uncharacterized membrane protein YfcA